MQNSEKNKKKIFQKILNKFQKQKNNKKVLNKPENKKITG